MSGERFDVAVAGGGPAGIAAALAAASAGARTLLVERGEVLGGNAANAFVHTICGLYRAADEGDAVPAAPGFAQRFAALLRKDGAAGAPERAGRVWFLPIDPMGLAARADALCRAAKELTVRRSSELAAVSRDEGGFALELRGKAEPLRLGAALLVDASGDAAAAALAGAAVDAAAPDALQNPSYIVRLADVDTRVLEGFARIRVSAGVGGAVRRGSLAPECESVLVHPHGPAAARGEAFLQVNVPKPAGGYVPLDPACLAALERSARASAEQVLDHLRSDPGAFAAARVAAWPQRIGVRETRRVRGREVLSEDDVLEGRRRGDEVALSTWPIELWSDHRRARFRHPEGPCSLPLGALISASDARIACAGRCVSATHEALGALRVIGTALAGGEAAGTAAALAADAGSTLAELAPAAVRERIEARAAGEGA